MLTYEPQSYVGEGLLCIRGERTVFTALDFAVAAGDVLVLSGPNGSGKSSLLRMMAGLLLPIAGTLWRNGVAVQDDPEYHHASLHYVGHLDAVKPVLSVAENLAFWATVKGDAAQVSNALERFGLAPLAGIAGRILSSGQRRRLNLARIVANSAPLWLLDEPAVGLDAASVGILTSLIAEHRAKGGIVILSTHTDLGIDDAASLHLDDFTTAVLAA
jgi:heme exporter protein A